MLAVEVYLKSAISRNGIPLHNLPALIDGEGAFAGGEGDAAEVAAGAFAGGFCPAESFFRVVEVVGGEHFVTGMATGYPIQ